MFTANEKELMMRNELRVIEDMKELLTHSADEGLTWRGTKTDLVEMVHILYESEELTDDDGLPVTFKQLLLRCCSVVHERVPRNPATYLTQARQCKGIRRAPLLVRYRGELMDPPHPSL
ncbi:MAG: hypothetical protein IKQ47_08740 [Prevotella sp.]|nr:hypothetical protein [Prevotella sp.]